MQLRPSHIDGESRVHLTHTTLTVEALCGETITHHGSPHHAVACDDCVTVVLELGLDVTEWYELRDALPEPPELRLAA